MAIALDHLRKRLQGLLAFPVTPFTEDDEIDVPRFIEHLQYLISWKPAAIFVCAGTGEFYSLNLHEYRRLVRASVEEVAGRIPIIAGVGYGTRLAMDFANAAQEEGADGILVMPPYLVHSEQEGLFEHYRLIARSTKLGLVLYQRDNAVFAPETVGRLADIPNIIGFKDGYGDMDRLTRIRLLIGDRLVLINGMPTAEMSAKAFLGAGVSSYSSAVFNFVPEISLAFYNSLISEDELGADRLLEGFYRPFSELRDRARGYAVSLIKAGLRILGKPVGPARPPLVNPSAEHEAELRLIIERGLSLVRSVSIRKE